MAIPASNIVSVNPRVLSAGGNDLEINGLLLTRNENIPLASMVMEFTSASAVGDYLGTDSWEYIAAVKYFAGYTGCFAYPRRMMIARYLDEDAGAEIRGAKYADKLGDLQAITDGVLKLEYNGTEYEFTGLDFSEATTYSDIATTLTEAISAEIEGAEVTYSSLTGGYKINVPYVADTDNELEAVDSGEENDLAVILSLLADDGAINSTGSAALSVDDNFKAIRAKTDNWVTFTTVWEPTDEEIMAYTQWAMAQGVQYLYVAWSAEKSLEVQGEETSIATQLEAANVSSVTLIHKDSDIAAFVESIGASIDWNRNQGLVTWAFRSQSGLEPTVTDETLANTLLNKKVNFYGQYATRNDDHIVLYDGKMFGEYKYIDAYIGAVWLNNALQQAIFNGLEATGRVPYNERGYALIRSWMADPIARARYNGVIDEGVTLSEAQKAEVYNETGREISDELYANGYVVIIEDADPSVRADRESPNISLYYCYGGSVHKIVVASTALL